MAQPIRFALLASRFEKSKAITEHEKIIKFLIKGDLGSAALFMEQHVVRNIQTASLLYGQSSSPRNAGPAIPS